MLDYSRNYNNNVDPSQINLYMQLKIRLIAPPNYYTYISH